MRIIGIHSLSIIILLLIITSKRYIENSNKDVENQSDLKPPVNSRIKEGLKSVKQAAIQTPQSIKRITYNTADDLKSQSVKAAQEVHKECFETLQIQDIISSISSNWRDYIYIPYLPAFHRPGWLLRYIFGPYDWELLEMSFADFWAGITVAITLLPQALSYATLANLPPINGLYTAILPSATYVILGSSMILAVGPVALVSLLVGQLILQYGITPGSQESVNFAGEAAVAVGLILAVLSILNMGNFIRFISHPVMSGFTTAAAALIGFSQLKNAFGFPGASSHNPNFTGTPQTGQTNYEYNYEVMKWYADNWNGVYTVETAPYKCSEYSPPCLSKCNANNCVLWSPNPNSVYIGNTYINPLAVKICIGLYIPLFVIANIRLYWKPNNERNKSYLFKTWYMLSSMTSLAAIIIGGHLAWKTKNNNNNFYATQLKVIGPVTAGLDFFRAPTFNYSFGQLIGDVFPLTIIAFMESYSVAHRLATRRNELYFLSASQELFANAAANFMASVSSSYPISGSYSRSSLNEASGARTPMSKATTLLTIVVVLGALTNQFQDIPYCALAAVVWVSIWSLLSFSDFWDAWKNWKKDFLVMLITTSMTFIFDTSIGLASGVGASVIVFLCDSYLATLRSPVYEFKKKSDEDYIVILKMESDLTFIQAGKFTDLFETVTRVKKEKPSDDLSFNAKAKYNISNYLDQTLGRKQAELDFLASAIVFDLQDARVFDLTGMKVLEEAMQSARLKGMLAIVINVHLNLVPMLKKYGIQNDRSSPTVDLDSFLVCSKGINFVTTTTDRSTPVEGEENNSLLNSYAESYDDLTSQSNNNRDIQLSTHIQDAYKPINNKEIKSEEDETLDYDT